MLIQTAIRYAEAAFKRQPYGTLGDSEPEFAPAGIKNRSGDLRKSAYRGACAAYAGVRSVVQKATAWDTRGF